MEIHLPAVSTIKRLPRATLSSQIAEQIRDAILSGKFPGGSQLHEAQLAENFGVSRGPLREAMQRLIQEGLLYSEPHRGVFVMSLTQDDYSDIEFARHAIELAAWRRIVGSDKLMWIHKRLSRIAEDMEEAAREQNWRRVVELDLEFHRQVIAIAGSARLARAYATLQAETRLCMHMSVKGYMKNPALVAEHRQLADALLKGRELIEHHLTASHHRCHPNNADLEDDCGKGKECGAGRAA